MNVFVTQNSGNSKCNMFRWEIDRQAVMTQLIRVVTFRNFVNILKIKPAG